eukprot:m.83094 g.83094  ORF g.83094 m.83094 type:complete len:362 (-) comp9515_c0_seq2:189-1274(-)
MRIPSLFNTLLVPITHTLVMTPFVCFSWALFVCWYTMPTTAGKPLEALDDKTRELAQRPEIPDRHMYLAELRHVHKYRHAISNEWVKTALSCDVKDVVPASHRALMPYWDVWDEGVFVGAAWSGSPLHVDQVSWSNIGKNFRGYKLMALWEYGPPSFAMLDKDLRIMFVNRDNASQMNVLKDAVKIVIAHPGDLFLFSGANPHTAMCMGDGVSLTAYESFVNLNPDHARVFAGTNGPNHYAECWADETDVEDIFDDTIDTIEDALEQVDGQSLHEHGMHAERPAGSPSASARSTPAGGTSTSTCTNTSTSSTPAVVPTPPWDDRLTAALYTCVDTLASTHLQFERWFSRRKKRRRRAASPC